MEAHPAAALIRTQPVIVNARSLFSRLQQFAGQILVELGDDARPDIGMKGVSHSASAFGGATTTSAGTFLTRTTCSIAAGTLFANRCSSM
jgi:hypothetical protein